MKLLLKLFIVTTLTLALLMTLESIVDSAIFTKEFLFEFLRNAIKLSKYTALGSSVGALIHYCMRPGMWRAHEISSLKFDYNYGCDIDESWSDF